MTRVVISGDSHVVEPLDLWLRPLSAKYGTRTPQAVKGYKGQPGTYFFSGVEYLKADELVEGSTPEMKEKLRRAGYDPHVRLECMAEDGVWAEVCNATFMLYSMRIPDPDLVRDCCSVYNAWIAEYISAAPKRLIGSAMIAMEDVPWATAELERAAKRDLRSVIIYADTKRDMLPYRHSVYDRFWAAAQAHNMPVTIHIITGQARDPFTLHGEEERTEVARCNLNVLQEAGPVLANEFIFGGILDRFPGLKIVLSEYEVSWLPYWIYRLRQIQDDFGPALSIPKIGRPVEEYMSQIYHGLIDDPYLDKVLDVVDPKTIMWGSDFPHPRCTYPNTRKVVDTVLGHLDPKIQADIAGLNAARFYNIELPTQFTAAAD
jgi:predicted TIM-barrel fold metal-dependent hydrolase